MDKTWFEYPVSPARAGVYQLHEGGFCFWSGEYWGCIGSSPENAMQIAHIPAQRQEKTWSGLTVEQYAEACHRIAIIEIRRSVEAEFMRDVERMQRIRKENLARHQQTGAWA